MIKLCEDDEWPHVGVVTLVHKPYKRTQKPITIYTVIGLKTILQMTKVGILFSINFPLELLHLLLKNNRDGGSGLVAIEV